MRNSLRFSFLRVLLSVVVAIVLFLGGPAKSHADSLSAAVGWFWGGSDDGAGVQTGLGWVSIGSVTGGGPIGYGVNIPTGDGELSGFAYSENMGFIVFDNQGGYLQNCPDLDCRAYRSGNRIQGWARFTDIAQAGSNAGGNLGWIHLSGTAQDGEPYGITIGNDGALSGYAWSDEFGAIRFDGVNIPPPGACGYTEVPSLASAPSTNLCSSGTASAVTGTGPWYWNCVGANGGSTANCWANKFCAPADCSSQASQVCRGETFTMKDGCGNSQTCDGTRNCSLNWKEVAPGG